MKHKFSINRLTLAFASLLLAAVFSVGCNNVESIGFQKETFKNSFGSGISIITVDSCEYVWRKVDYGAGLCHKGNCKFCAARHSR